MTDRWNESGYADRGRHGDRDDYLGGGSSQRGAYGSSSGDSRERSDESGFRSGGGAGFGSGMGSYGRTGEGQDRYGQGGYGQSGYGQDRRGGNDRDWMDRAGDEVRSWFGDDDAGRRREMDQHRGKGPKGYNRSDDRIRDDVCDRLSDDPRTDASDIEVSVSEGEVTLNGTVTDRQSKRSAEDCVDRVSGVQHVQNNLRVKQGGSNVGDDTASTGDASRTATRVTA